MTFKKLTQRFIQTVVDHLGYVEEEGDYAGGGEEHVRGELKVLKVVLVSFQFVIKAYVSGPAISNCQ